MKRIGIFGGTFDPVHQEHVLLSISAVNELNLDKLYIMPTYISPHKKSKPASAEDRLNMLRLAFANCDKIEVSDYEIKKQGKSFTYLTVEHFKNTSSAQIYFIVGGDMLTDFRTWRYPERILDSCTLAVFDREDFYTDYQKEKEYFKKTFNKEFVKLSYLGKDASSTKIRIYSSLGLSLSGIGIDKVNEYVKDKGLYNGDIYTDFLKEHLTEKRLVHTAEVTITALSKARELSLDSEKVRISALLHDLAKYIDYKKVDGFELPEGVPSPVVHAFLGAYIAEKQLKIEDEEILNAIRYHTSGRENMTLLEKLIFVADMIEKNRSYEGVEKLREYFYGQKDFDKCFVECLKEEFLHLINKKQSIYQETVKAFAYYVKN